MQWSCKQQRNNHTAFEACSGSLEATSSCLGALVTAPAGVAAGQQRASTSVASVATTCWCLSHVHQCRIASTTRHTRRACQIQQSTSTGMQWCSVTHCVWSGSMFGSADGLVGQKPLSSPLCYTQHCSDGRKLRGSSLAVTCMSCAEVIVTIEGTAQLFHTAASLHTICTATCCCSFAHL